LKMVKVKRFGMSFSEFYFSIGQIDDAQDIRCLTETSTLSCVRRVQKGFKFLAGRQRLTFLGKIFALPKKHTIAPNCPKPLSLIKIEDQLKVNRFGIVFRLLTVFV
jgi:hypothetical protein